MTRSTSSPGVSTTDAGPDPERVDRSVTEADGDVALEALIVADATWSRVAPASGAASGPRVPKAMPPATIAVLAATPATAATAALPLTRSRARPNRNASPTGTEPPAAAAPR